MDIEILKKDTPIEGVMYQEGDNAQVEDPLGQRLINFGFARKASRNTGDKAVPREEPKKAVKKTGAKTADRKPVKTAGGGE